MAKADAEQLATELAAELIQLQKTTTEVAESIKQSVAEQIDARATDVATNQVRRVQEMVSSVMDGVARRGDSIRGHMSSQE